ncbi:hypothetical protein KTT_37860 [Tengunoibacter tsumagoiensis]|uniref:Uncharacterized protein n=1 Tax=Tengunoibacter tsumagoiensis TaxID=2014871 RepID=A0A402A454_9CHLR|nr:hypothetical protein KTT_37860 [Tengunoibacter tsumagoiensis]
MTEPRTEASSPLASGPVDRTPDWSVVKAKLGFTIFLPESLPATTCLLSASGQLRDPLFGSNFVLTYLLEGQDAITFSQSQRSSSASPLSLRVQCSISSELTLVQQASSDSRTGQPVQICTGVRNTTEIVLSARGTDEALQRQFSALKPGVDWLPHAAISLDRQGAHK